jgi:CubicO group peptidase (beta-lactamase class C family)
LGSVHRCSDNHDIGLWPHFGVVLLTKLFCMHHHFTALCFALILSFFSSHINAQDSPGRLFDNRPAVEQWIRENKVPALGIGVIREGKPKEIRVYGETQKGITAPYNTLFNVASLTKPVFAMLVLKLVSDGKLSLDEPLYPYWIDPDLIQDPRHRMLTPRLVLSHQTGFKNWRYLEKNNKLGFDAAPGARFGYSGEGFEYLRKALENKFKMKMEALSDSLILRPLKMQDTRHAWTKDIDEKRFAHWYDGNGKEYERDYKLTGVTAADDMITSIEDYGKFAAWDLAGGGLDTTTFAEMTRPHVETKNGMYFGLGWEMILNLGRKKEYALIHTGSDAGVRTLAILLPASNEGLVVFTNSDNGTKLYGRTVVEFLEVGKELMSRAK